MIDTSNLFVTVTELETQTRQVLAEAVSVKALTSKERNEIDREFRNGMQKVHRALNDLKKRLSEADQAEKGA